MAQVLSLSDLNSTIDNEPRIADLRLAEILGFKRPSDIRPLIDRHIETLRHFGEVLRTARRTTAKGGRPTFDMFLNQKQAVFICTKSETERATEITIQVVEVFDKAINGQLVQAQTVGVEQMYKLRRAVNDVNARTGLHHATIWSRFNNHFHIPRYRYLPAHRFAEAMEYLAKLGQQKQLAAPDDSPARELYLRISNIRTMANDARLFPPDNTWYRLMMEQTDAMRQALGRQAIKA